MMKSALLPTTVISLSATFALSAGIALAQTLPGGQGKEVVEKICSGCHDLDPITSGGGGTREDWDMVVHSMIDMGADIKPEQIALITGYLAQNFPPKQKR
jgi:virginiamycin B lyase